jgi:hypothetical protein
MKNKSEVRKEFQNKLMLYSVDLLSNILSVLIAFVIIDVAMLSQNLIQIQYKGNFKHWKNVANHEVDQSILEGG